MDKENHWEFNVIYMMIFSLNLYVMKKDAPYIINSISELHSFLNLKKPTYPLVSVINFADIKPDEVVEPQSIVYNFYTIHLKKNCDAKIRYGQQYYDFNSGVMVFFEPKQMLVAETQCSPTSEGWMLVIHPDLILGHLLVKKIREYGFFSYAVNEALHISDQEENIISEVFQNLKEETEKMADHYTKDVVISHIELLLNYCNRFYNRQFVTRKTASKEILSSLENLINDYFDNKLAEKSGIPSVQYFADKLHLSSNYLSDILRSLTGQNTKQHIHNRLIDKAKELLSTTELSVAEIAYQLGFDHPQSFHKLFKSKTQISPSKFRQSLH